MTRRKCEWCLDVLPTGTPLNFRKCKQCYVAAKRREQHELHERAEAAEAKVLELGYELMLAKRKLEFAEPDPVKALRELGFDLQTITRLISLCHPDRHGNSETSNDLTRLLLSIRKQMAQPEGD